MRISFTPAPPVLPAFADATFAAPEGLGPLLAEARVWRELAQLTRHPVWRGTGVPDGGGLPVLLIPGFMANDASLRILSGWLRRRGYCARRSEMRLNVACAQALVPNLERVAERLAERRGRRIALIGQSRGGGLAKLLAVRRPDVVAGIVTLGSPNLAPVTAHPVVRGASVALTRLSRLGVPGLIDDDCFSGECAHTMWSEMQSPFPNEVDYVSVYSRSDGIVDWRACLDPAAEHVEVRSSHIGMAVNAEVYAALGLRLALTAP